MKGFTIIELILVIAIIGILGAMSSPVMSAFLSRNNYQVATDRILSELLKAQSYAMEGKSVDGDKVWGVCLNDGKIRMFNGSCASSNYNEEYTLPPTVSVGGLSSITFGNLRGEPSNPVSITVSSIHGMTTITVNAGGMIGRN